MTLSTPDGDPNVLRLQWSDNAGLPSKARRRPDARKVMAQLKEVFEKLASVFKLEIEPRVGGDSEVKGESDGR